MSEPRAEVKNAADPQQVRRAATRERDSAQRAEARLRNVLKTEDGRGFIWDLLESYGTFRSIWHASALIHYNAGMQDCGHRLMATVTAVDGGKWYLLMQQEAIARASKDDSERAALHTARAREQGDGNVDN